ncbi:hypothetical protein [Paenibacillus alginolyticus]|uniref:Uncharacterized protein n=1 Tax=Paenibacillus alginolyticus TaxID=59839 RepID=A0ABT4GIY0_9BACL|nr:hypothetical protein [Paenibacillus alginolyticus]MCY9696148.1 hypothetical protein [Paenibacillus alginolyticus]MEC0143301.1 hypothetical protein [Paenibacillus alginolyticus]
MKNKDKQFLQKWKRKREIGSKKYIFMHGFLGFGVMLTLLFSAIEIITNGSIIMNYMISRIVLLPTLGIIIFSTRWDSREKKYNRLVTR